jgi:hypothetical protein
MKLLIALALVFLIGGYVWQRTDAAASGRVASLADTLSEDDRVSIGFSACGILSQDVRIIAYNFGVEDPVLEDVYADKIANGELRDDFYHLGFRRVISGNRVSRIVVQRQASTIQENESGDLAALVGEQKP